MTKPPARPLKLTAVEDPKQSVRRDVPLPGILHTATRSGVSAIDPLLAGITVEKQYTFATTNRGAAGKSETTVMPEAPELLALEAEDGTTLFIRSDALAEAVERVRPEAVVDGAVDFTLFRDPNATARGLGDVLWKVASVLTLPTDGLVKEAETLAIEWAKKKLGEKVEEEAYKAGSFLGTKALIWKIESRLAGRPGLYRWQNKTLDPADYCAVPSDPRLADMAAGKPALVLIHGTASYTLASFGALREDDATWSQLSQRFPGGIFGYEHRTFSESPAENAEALLAALPKGARVSLLTHSRGGLVGDLLCLGQVKDDVIGAYRIDTTDADDPDGLEREAQEERTRLRAIRDQLATGGITVERYVRVACPARGTRFLSENLDAALSDFLNLLQWGGGALVGAVASALGGPVAGESFGQGASSCLGVVKRLVLEIAARRIDARLMPGIAAMRIDSPLASFLAHPDTHRRDGIMMAVIAGDTEFEGFGLSDLRRRIANLFCDWRLFGHNDNDLVVDTDSMYAGLGFREGAKYLYDQDSSVTHFRYFHNPPTRDALRGWLTEETLDTLAQFQPLSAGAKTSWQDRDARAVQRGAPAGPRPVAIIVPGIMGSHIEIDRQRLDQPGSGTRIWLNPLRLCAGELARIGDPDANNVQAEDIFELCYGELAEYLSQTHVVVRCAYDWRLPLDKCALQLKAKIEQAALEQPGQPIRLLAHSMGGLVARALIENHKDAWDKVLASGGRLLMLGTPNNGAHLMVHTLLGKSTPIRMLKALDVAQGMPDLLNIVAGFPGALALLPRPGFTDTGAEPRIPASEYYDVKTWNDLKDKNTDRWYGAGICGVPDPIRLKAVQLAWQSLPKTIANPDRVAYVFGQSDKTACGVQAADGRLKLLFTADGDGMVTWESGKLDGLDPDTRCWYMPVSHIDLTGEDEYFPAIAELLEKGTTDKLDRLPRRRGEPVPGFVLEAEPPVVPGAEELARAFMGSGPRRRKPSRAGQVLKVSVRGGNVSFMDQPVLCGHYIGDAISGAEAALDRKLDGALSERDRMGVYAGDIGTSAIVLRPPSGEERARHSLPGAVIVGLGKFTGQLSAREVSETVRAAVLRFLLQLRDAIGIPPETPVQLCSLLIGWGSAASISLGESVAAITRGVLEANHEFRDAAGKAQQPAVTVTDLCFVELYRDAAITAAEKVCELPALLVDDLKCLGARIDPAPSLVVGDGVVDRLTVATEPSHWSRLIVTDADATETDVAPQANSTAAVVGSATRSDALAAYYPERLKYIFLSQRARAETVWQRRQPGLIEDIIRDQRHNPGYDPKLGQTLFQLMVPLDYKAVARDQARLLLVVDGYTANLPWELLQADGEPMVIQTRMIRQLATSTYRPTIRTANTNAACIIVNPSTYGFNKRFPGGYESLADLSGAVREGNAICETLRAAGWSELVVTPPEKEALEIFKTLYDRPYRVLMIGAHGIVEAKGLDGRNYTGVVLSDGLLITAVEVGQMEAVPEVVILSCCHLGKMSNPYSKPNELGYSLARELIEMGVRCVVAAGWEVNDDAACTFSSTFFDQMTKGRTFGDAIFDARRAAYRQHPGCNTWGAYQAYGDPGYRLNPGGSSQNDEPGRPYVAVEQVLSAIRQQQVRSKRPKPREKALTFAQQRQWAEGQLARCPPDWAQRPDVLQALGELCGETGADGFDAARDAYQRAVQLEDSLGRVAVRSIEQLANMEARQGERLVADGQAGKALPLIESAIRRLESLADSVRGEDGSELNPERAALLGSAFKRKAAALAAQKKTSWQNISLVLGKAAAAYRSGIRGDAAKCPYMTLNALPLAWLSGTLKPVTTEEAAGIARHCGEQARRAFADTKKFWDAVMSADADMTAWLLDGKFEEVGLETRTGDCKAKTPAQALKERYEQAVLGVPPSAREWDSVVKQWRLLAQFLSLRRVGRGKDQELAAILNALADEYAPSALDTRPAVPPAPAAAPKKRTARRAPPKPTRKTR
jgi:CHAT domain-containing protein/pimeloyl-ACP methyl ester carboxylesterase